MVVLVGDYEDCGGDGGRVDDGGSCCTVEELWNGSGGVGIVDDKGVRR